MTVSSSLPLLPLCLLVTLVNSWTRDSWLAGLDRVPGSGEGAVRQLSGREY